ncbi:hypothetical protein [Nocardioides sambongensis]|uniref:hypothetical protein n=1 Tax=Nocardioides sambongensis TaxID=2589074 RepID=UPI001E2B89E7|nr:hypothetical protein [Nocardioides sambongensis]
MDAGGGRRARRQDSDQLAQRAHRHPQRRRHLGGPGGEDLPANGWTLVTSRKPDDLEAFADAAIDAFAAT